MISWLLVLGLVSPMIISPLPDNFVSPTPTIASKLTYRGTASYYSESGCLGCSPTLTMANGERLDDDKLTIAMPPAEVRRHKLLNKVVTVQNVESQAVTQAKVTDTGGFAVYHRIADLSVAVKRSLRCPDLCIVKITVE